MFELFKSALLGSVSQEAKNDGVRAVLEDLVERRKITRQEASKTAARLSQESDEIEGAKSGLSEAFQRFLENANVATRQDIERLEARLTRLEKKLKTRQKPTRR